jgi:ubiquinone/menaquinone biosynthesis C-methylase UbiE
LTVTPEVKPSDELQKQNQKVRRSWAKQAPKYDKSMSFFERRVFGAGHRTWACSKASGDTLEVALGTALNVPLYAPDVRLTGIDLSPEMLAIARKKVTESGRDVDIREGDAHELPFPDASFDTVLCTYSLCNIPDPARAIGEMKRVLRPGGRLILVDHIGSSIKLIFWIQKLIEFFSLRFEGEHMTRRPSGQVEANGFDFLERERLALGGIIERLVAIKRAKA